MGLPTFPVYGKADVSSAIIDTEKAIAKIKTNKFDKKDLLTLQKAQAELIKALSSDDYKD